MTDHGIAMSRQATRQPAGCVGPASVLSKKSPLASARILVVDDDALHRKMLEKWLTHSGCSVRVAESGEHALSEVRSEVPDMVLLDIQMPGIDGIEVLERLRRNYDVIQLPIVMTTSVKENDSIARALELGANDYVTKPLDARVLLARLNSQLSLRDRTLEVEEVQGRLAEQYERLAELDGMKESLVQMIVHDLRSPLTSILGYVELTERERSKPNGDPFRFLSMIQSSSETLLKMVTGMLDLAKLEAATMSLNPVSVELPALLEDVRASVDSVALTKSLEIEFDIETDTVIADREILRRVIVNILDNAVRVAPDSSKVTICALSRNDGVRIEVKDRGPGIPESSIERVFDKFGQIRLWKDQHKTSTGLGLTFCKMAVEAHGGRIGVDSIVGEGSTFWFVLPHNLGGKS